MSDRKYRQQGYQDRGRETSEKREPPRPKDSLEGPRAMQMPGTRSVSRCAQCGTVLPAMVENLAQCPKCGAALHTCKQCTYFDPGSRFECRQPVPERVARKDAANNCTYYSMKVTVEKETSAAAGRVDDARKACENLFKK